MSILIVGNVTKDIYLNLDSRTEHFETDKHHTKWLNLSFDASEHCYFNRESSYGGAAVTLEVLQKIGIKATITGSTLSFENGTPQIADQSLSHRYILVADGRTSYIAPSSYQITRFDTPSSPYDYIFIDRSATLDSASMRSIATYLDLSPNTKLVIYARNLNNQYLNALLPRASLIFSEEQQATPSSSPNIISSKLSAAKIIKVSEHQISYLDIEEPISAKRIDMLTHLSAYSIVAATILGSFISGESIETSFRMAKANLENSKLNSTLSLEELQTISSLPHLNDDLDLIANNLVLHPKGILAADESGGSIHKKFAQLNIPDTYDNRRDYRNIFFTTDHLEQYVNGVILFDETARQLADNGQNFVEFLTSKRIIPGIKVDQGLAPLSEITSDVPSNTSETYTKGLSDLPTRLREYYYMGLRFAKWRAAFSVTLDENGEVLTPSSTAITENCLILAKYAKDCQSAGLVPIVEPELVYDGNYSIDVCRAITSEILDQLFQALLSHDVRLEACILKCNMVLAGKQFTTSSTSAEVGKATSEVLKTHVPSNLAGVVFLSGGQSVEEATANLATIENNGPFPWPVTFSFARALQDPALYAWAGNNDNIEKARQAFLDRLKANCIALGSLDNS